MVESQNLVEIILRVRDEFSKGMKNFDKQLTRARKGVPQMNTNVQNLGKTFGKVTNALRDFQGAFLSFLFTGMAIQRLFSQIGRAAFDTFTKVMATVDGAATSMSMLGVGVDFLKFSIGQAINTALMPLMPMILSIIELVSNWIQQNPKLVAWIVILGIVLGTLLMVVSMFVLTLSGLVNFIKGPIIKAIGAFIHSPGGLLMLAKAFLIIIALIILLWAMWKTNFGNIQEFTKGVWESTLIFAKNMFAALVKIVGGVLDIIVGLFEGDFEKVSNGIKKVVLGIAEFLLNAFASIITTIINLWSFAWNIIKDLFFNIVVQGILYLAQNMIDSLLGMLISLANSIGLKDIASTLRGARRDSEGIFSALSARAESARQATTTGSLGAEFATAASYDINRLISFLETAWGVNTDSGVAQPTQQKVEIVNNIQGSVVTEKQLTDVVSGNILKDLMNKIGN